MEAKELLHYLHLLSGEEIDALNEIAMDVEIHQAYSKDDARYREWAEINYSVYRIEDRESGGYYDNFLMMEVLTSKGVLEQSDHSTSRRMWVRPTELGWKLYRALLAEANESDTATESFEMRVARSDMKVQPLVTFYVDRSMVETSETFGYMRDGENGDDITMALFDPDVIIETFTDPDTGEWVWEYDEDERPEICQHNDRELVKMARRAKAEGAIAFMLMRLPDTPKA